MTLSGRTKVLVVLAALAVWLSPTPVSAAFAWRRVSKRSA
jgi:hypothetical protein